MPHGERLELGDGTGWVPYRDVESWHIGHEGLGGASYANDVPPEGATSVVIHDQEGEHVLPVENGEWYYVAWDVP